VRLNNKDMNYMKCGVCGIPANGGGCQSCQRWFCKDHMYRHPNCEEGR
jgi:hypothetical protein